MHKNRFKQHSLLVITHSYKPLLNPRAFRWTAILEEWATDGTRIDVITSWQPGQAREEIINNVHVFRVNDSIIEKVRTKFNNSDRKTTATKNKATHKESTVKKIVKSTLKNLHDFTWKNLYWPDYATLWKKTAIKNAEYLIEHESYDTIISISDPFTSHLVGYALKNKYPNLKWMVDIGDPFCFRHDTPTNNHALYYKKNYKIEKEIFAKTDCISVTTETTKQKYAELFPESSDKINVIPPLMAPSTQVSKILDNHTNSIKLIFVGTLYKAIRNPHYLLHLFSKLLHSNISDKLELHFYGGINDCQSEFTSYRSMVNKNLFLHGLVPREEVLQAMDNATVLINIGNDNMYQLPSKIVEYVLTGKPIINIAKLSNDSSTEFLQSYPSTLILFDNQENNVEHEFSKCISFLNNLPELLSVEKRNIWKNNFSTSKITNQYKNLILKTDVKEKELIL